MPNIILYTSNTSNVTFSPTVFSNNFDNNFVLAQRDIRYGFVFKNILHYTTVLPILM